MGAKVEIVIKSLDDITRGRVSIKSEKDAEDAFFDFCEKNHLYAKEYTFEIAG